MSTLQPSDELDLELDAIEERMNQPRSLAYWHTEEAEEDMAALIAEVRRLRAERDAYKVLLEGFGYDPETGTVEAEHRALAAEAQLATARNALEVALDTFETMHDHEMHARSATKYTIKQALNSEPSRAVAKVQAALRLAEEISKTVTRFTNQQMNGALDEYRAATTEEE